MSYYISKSDIQTIKNVILDKESEACGYLLIEEEKGKDKEKLILFLESYGEKNTCTHKEYTQYIWHTHPKSENGYPSYQDVVDMLRFHKINYKYNYPICSIIFTTWGIWEINSREKFDLGTEWRVYLNDIVEKQGHDLFFKDKEGKRTNGIKEYIRNIEDTINKNKFLNIKNKELIKITFAEWPKGDGNYCLRLAKQL
jgi:hypothetical protein